MVFGRTGTSASPPHSIDECGEDAVHAGVAAGLETPSERRDEAAPATGRRVAPPAAGIAFMRQSKRADGKLVTEPYAGYFLISQGWQVTAPAMAAVYLLLSMAWLKSSDRLGVATAAVAVIIAAFSGLFVRFERQPRRSLALRYVLMVVAVAVPMALFGLAVSICAATAPQAGMAASRRGVTMRGKRRRRQ